MSTDLALPDASAKAELATEALGGEELLALVDDLTIASADDLEFAEGLLLSTEAQHAAFEARRTAITGPMGQAKRAVDALFAPVLKPRKYICEKLRLKIGQYTVARNAASVAAMAAVAAGDIEVAYLAPVAHESGVTVKEVLDYDVVDFDALPDEFKQPNHTAILAALKGMTWPTCHIPGLGIHVRGAVRVGGSR